FYLADDEALVEDEALLEQASKGPDWVCAFCGTSNASERDTCRSCGAARDADSQQQAVTDFGVGQAPTTGDMTVEERPAKKEAAPKADNRLKFILAGVAALAVLCVGLVVIFLVFGGRETGAEVSGFEWQRTVAVESFQTVEEEDWSVPEGGRIKSQREEIHHYDDVLDHYETRQRQVQEQVQVGTEQYVCGQRDLGNGFFEDIQCDRPIYETQSRTETYEEPIYRQEPVYQTLYVYDIDKWTVVRTEEASGRDHSPMWPRSDLTSDEREGETTELYVVVFTDEEGESHRWETTLDRWQALEMGQEVLLEFDTFGNLEEVSTP
ncbi:MAG: zinc finger Ran-binding domain-containing protein, partial [Chloroflexota bacterium]